MSFLLFHPWISFGLRDLFLWFFLRVHRRFRGDIFRILGVFLVVGSHLFVSGRVGVRG